MSGLKLENVRNEEFAIARVLIQTNGIIASDPFDPIMCIEAKIYTTCHSHPKVATIVWSPPDQQCPTASEAKNRSGKIWN